MRNIPNVSFINLTQFLAEHSRYLNTYITAKREHIRAFIRDIGFLFYRARNKGYQDDIAIIFVCKRGTRIVPQSVIFSIPSS